MHEITREPVEPTHRVIVEHPSALLLSCVVCHTLYCYEAELDDGSSGLIVHECRVCAMEWRLRSGVWPSWYTGSREAPHA